METNSSQRTACSSFGPILPKLENGVQLSGNFWPSSYSPDSGSRIGNRCSVGREIYDIKGGGGGTPRPGLKAAMV